MTLKLKSYLLGAAVGVVVFGVLASVWFVPLEVAIGAGVVIGLASILLIRSLLDRTFLLGRDRDEDETVGERQVWTVSDMDRLSPHAAWANGSSILAHPEDTQEMPRPKLDDQTHVHDAEVLYRYQSRHGAGAR